MSAQKTIKFFHDKIAKEYMDYWKFKQKVENRIDLFTDEKEKLVDERYAEYKLKESEYEDIIESVYYDDISDSKPIYNI